MGKRIIAAHIFCLVLLAGMMFRLLYLSQGTMLAQAAQRQSNYVLPIARSRGIIYDCSLEPLVAQQPLTIAAVLPSPQSATAMAQAVPLSQRQDLLAMLENGKPFIFPVTTTKIYSPGVNLFTVPQRYSQNPLATHIIGYMQEGKGVSGIEKSYDVFLEEQATGFSLSYEVDALGNALPGSTPRLVGSSTPPTGGVVLTLDKQIQVIAQQAVGASALKKGAVVVMDVQTGDIKASVSIPTFMPNDVAASLENQNAPFINRAFSAFNVGSSFKLCVAAAALEAGIPPTRQYQCKGYMELAGRVFRCHNLAGHGVVDMHDAIRRSCNPYFIQLVQDIGVGPVLDMAVAMGFGTAITMAPGITAQSGNLPNESQLTGGELANLAFGQGLLTATPVQIAAMIASIANGGKNVTPRLVKGLTEDGQALLEENVSYAQNPIMKAQTAQYVQQFMIDVIETGSGTQARPDHAGAGGKTASAQTGQFIDDEEIVHAWFVGFYPAIAPKYSIVVLFEEGDSGGTYAAPIFKEIVDKMYAAGK